MSDPSNVLVSPFDEWSSQPDNVTDDPINTHLKYLDYVRGEYLKANKYDEELEKSLQNSFGASLNKKGLLTEENLDSVNEQIQNYGKPTFGESLLFVQKNYDPKAMGLTRNEQSKLQELSAMFDEGEEIPLLMVGGLEETVRKARENFVKNKFANGEIDAGVYFDEEGNRRVHGGRLKQGATVQDLIEQGTGLKASDLFAIEANREIDSFSPDGKMRYEVEEARQVLNEIDTVYDQAKKTGANRDVVAMIEALGLEKGKKERWGWGSKAVSPFEEGLKEGVNFARFVGNLAIFDFDEANEVLRENALEDLREDYEEYADKTRSDLVSKLAKLTNRSESVIADVLEDTIDAVKIGGGETFDSVIQYDEDDLAKNVHITKYSGIKIAPELYTKPDLFRQALREKGVPEDRIDLEDTARIAANEQNFSNIDKLLSEEEGWDEAKIAGKFNELSNNEIVEKFVAEHDINVKWRGVGISTRQGFTNLIYGLPAIFGSDWGRQGLIENAREANRNRELAELFGVEMGWKQNTVEMVAPLIVDAIATSVGVAASGVTFGAAGAGTAAYFAAKQGAKASASGVARSVVANSFKRNLTQRMVRDEATGVLTKESLKDVAKRVQKAGVLKNASPKQILAATKAYNSQVASKLGLTVGTFVPAATRSSSAVYGSVYTTIEDSLTAKYKNLDGTWAEGWDKDRVKQEAHSSAYGASLVSGTITGLITTAFGKMFEGKLGGVESSLLKGMSYKQFKIVTERLTGKAASNKALLALMKESIRDTFMKEGGNRLAKYGYTAAKLGDIGLSGIGEGAEEFLDEFINGIVQDAYTNQDTPLLERLSQSFSSFFYGFGLGSAASVGGSVAKRLPIVGDALIDREQLARMERDIIDQFDGRVALAAQKDASLSEERNKLRFYAPQTAQAVENARKIIEQRNKPVEGAAPEEAAPVETPATDAQAEQEFDGEEEITEQEAKKEARKIKQIISGETRDIEDVLGQSSDTITFSAVDGTNVDSMVATNIGVQTVIFEGGQDAKIAGASLSSPKVGQVRIKDPKQKYEAGLAQAAKANLLWKKANQTAKTFPEGSPKRKEAEDQIADGVRNGKYLDNEGFSRAKNILKKLRELDEEDIKSAKGKKITENDKTSIERLINYGYPVSVIQEHLAELGLELDDTSGAELQRLSVYLKEEIEKKFPVNRAKPANAAAKLPADLFASTDAIKVLYLDKDGNGIFNNDPQQMLTFLRSGIDIPIPKRVYDQVGKKDSKVNPSFVFRFDEATQQAYVADILVPVNGGRVSANSNFGYLTEHKSDYLRISKLLATKESNEADLPNIAGNRFEMKIPNPFPTTDLQGLKIDKYITLNDLLEKAKNVRQMAEFVRAADEDNRIPKGNQTLRKRYYEAAGLSLSIRLQNRIFELARSAGSLDVSKGPLIDFPKMRDQELSYYSRMARNRKQQSLSDLSRLMKYGDRVHEDPTIFDVDKNSGDTGIPPTPDPLPVFAESETKDYLVSNLEAMAQALDNNPELRAEMDDFLDFEYHGSDTISVSNTRSSQEVAKDFVAHLITGENVSGQRTLDFIKRLDRLSNTDNEAYSLIIAMRALGVSSPTIHQDPDADSDLLAYVQSAMFDSFGDVAKDLEAAKVMEFFDHLRNAMKSYRMDAIEGGKTTAEILRSNVQQIEDLGLENGDPESVIAAMELIAKNGKPRFLRKMARIMLTNKDYIRSIDFRIFPSRSNYAGLYQSLPDKGIRRVILNPNRSSGKAGVAGTLVHEYIHAFTADIIAAPRGIRTAEQNQIIDNLERMRRRVREKAIKWENKIAHDATENIDEFITYMHTSPEFRQFVGGDMVQRVIDFIAKFFNLASSEHYDFIESMLWANKAIRMGMEVTEKQFAREVSQKVNQSQTQLYQLSEQAGTRSSLLAEARLENAAEYYTSWVRNYVPAEIVVETSDSSPVVAKIDGRSGNLVFNPKRAAIALNKLVSDKNVDPEKRNHVLAAIINEEIGHAAANEMLTDEQILEVIDAMTDADYEAIIKEYYPIDQREAALERLRSADSETVAVEKYKLANEAIVAHASMAMRGMTTNQQVAFLSTNPSLIPTFIQYLKAFLSKLTYHRTMKDLSPEMRTAVNNTVREIRAMELGYRPSPDSMSYNGRNGEAIVNQLVKQAMGNRMLSPEAPEDISLWDYPDQEISSAATSINQTKLPSTFGSLTNNGTVSWEEGTVNADIGGGSFDNATERLAELGVENLIYDPFNRSREHNNAVVERIINGGADTATVNNVLNVIKESGSRDQVIAQAANAIKQDGTAYFLIYEGSKAQQEAGGKETTKGWQNYRKAESYIGEIEEHFGKVTRKGNLLIATKPKQDVVVDLESQFGADILMPVHTAQQAVDDALLNGTKEIDAGIKGSRVHMLGRKMQALVDPKDAIVWDKNWKGSKKDWPTERARAAFFSDVDRMGDRLLGVLQRALNEYPDFVSWYEERVAMAMDIFEELDPDIKNPQDNFVMKTLMTVTSNGNKVKEQTEDSWALYQNWKKTGKLAPAEKFNPAKTQIVTTKSGREKKVEVSWIRGDRQPQIKNHLALIDKLIEKHSWETVSDFLSQKGTVKELREELVSQFGFSKKKAQTLTTGELIDEDVPFSLIFGAKLGSFYNNLNGDFDTVTMDRWFMRTFGRTAGHQLRKYTRAEMKEKKDRFDTALKNYLAKDPSGELLKEAGLGRKRKRSDEFVIKLDKHWTKAANRQKAYNAETKTWEEFEGEMELFSPLDNELRLATNALSKAVDGYELIEAPANGGHRRFIRLAMNDAIDKLEQKHGIKMVPAEAQAILWYYEKAVHAEYGSGKDGEAPDYATAAHGVFQEVAGERAGSFRESTANIRRRDLRDSTGGAAQRARRYNLDLESQFGSDSKIPSFLDEVEMQEQEIGQWLELLDVPLMDLHEYDIKAKDGTFGRTFKRWWIKTFQRRADKRVVAMFDQTNAMIRETKGLVAVFQKKHDRILTEETERLGVEIPASLIAQASGSTQGTQLSFDQEDQIQGEYLNAVEKARRLTGSARQQAIDAAVIQKEKSIERERGINRDRELKKRNAALKDLLKVSPKMYALVVEMRQLQDQISKKGMEVFDGSMDPSDLNLAFDYNRGLYITRRYRMFEDNDFAADVLESDAYAAVRDRAARFFARQKAFQKIDEVMTRNGVGYQVARNIIEADLVKNEAKHMAEGQQLMRAFVRGYRQGQARRQLKIKQGSTTQDIVLQEQFSDDALKAIAQTINERKNIPDPVRELLGEFTDEAGITNLSHSILHVNSMLANQSFFNKIKELGTKSANPWIIDQDEYNSDPEKYADWKQMKADAGDDDLAPIKGMYFPENVASDLEDLFGDPQEMRDINNERVAMEHAIGSLVRQGTGVSLAMKTMGSVGFYFRNMIGNALYFGPMQGYTGGFKLLYEEGKGMTQAVIGLDDINQNQSRMVQAARGSLAQLEYELIELKSMNVFGDELETTQIQNLLTGRTTYADLQKDLKKAGEMHQMLTNLIDKGTKAKLPSGVVDFLAKNGVIIGRKGSEGYGTVKEGAQALLELGGRLASAADAFYKIGLYNFELDTLMKAADAAKVGDPLKKMVVNGKPTSALKQMAAEIVKDTAQSYSRALPIIKTIGRNNLGVLFAPYIRFAADVPRVYINGLARGVKEWRSDNPVIKARGKRRLTGALLTTAASYASTKGSMMLLFGWDHEDEDLALRKTGPKWAEESGIMYTKWKDRIFSWDMTYLNPFATIQEPIMRGFEHLFRTGDITDAFIKTVWIKGLLKPFASEQILAGAIADVVLNEDQYGRKLRDESETNKGWKNIWYVFERAYAPKLGLSAIEAFKAIYSDKSEQAFSSPLGRILRDAVPIAPHEVDLDKRYRAFLINHTKDYRSARMSLEGQGSMTDGQIRAEVENFVRARKRMSHEFNVISRGFNKLGKSLLSIRQDAQSAGVSKERVSLNAIDMMRRPVMSEPQKVRMLSDDRNSIRYMKYLQFLNEIEPDQFIPLRPR